MGISTHTKGLASRIAKAASGVVNFVKRIIKGAATVSPTLKTEIGEKTQATKKGIFGVRRYLLNAFRRPLSDVSHLSIVMVIVLALFSGFSTLSLGESGGSVSTNPFNPAQQSASQFVSADQQRLLEADAVATLAGWHSDKLGQDAALVAEKMNNDLSTVDSRVNYLASVPVVAVDDSSSSQATGVKSYVVQSGDTLSTIASKFNISTDTVRYANGIANVDDLKPGDTLTILPVSGVLHTVASGDTLAGIASRYLVTEAIIVSTNDLWGVDITDGMKLLVPGGEIPEAPKPTPVSKATISSDDSNGSGGSNGSTSATFGSGNYMFPTSNAEGYYNGYHNWAIDIPGGIGTPIYAADSGRIVEAKYGYNGGFGNTILIDHGNGYQTRYGHMSSLNIIDGYVSKGQVIGFMGSTGRSTGSHLHFEIITGGTRLNPCNFFGGCSG